MTTIDIANLTPEQRKALLNELQEKDKAEEIKKKEAYIGIRTDFIARVKKRFIEYTEAGKDFKNFLRDESEAFFKIAKEYGGLKRDDQIGFTVSDIDFKMQVKGSKVKGFDERADIAEKRLIEFLQQWVANSEKGENDPMYKLAMLMIKRNEAGALDYKSISRLYELESDFNNVEYSDIMKLFKESNVVESTAIHFYFEQKDNYNIWRKVEPSFNRM